MSVIKKGKTVILKKGYNISLSGKAQPHVVTPTPPVTYAIKPTDFHGLGMPKLCVQIGDNVKAGSPLFCHKKDERICFSSPVSGEIVEIKRGEKRKLLEIKILADSQIEYLPFKKYSISEINYLSEEKIKEQMLLSGVWANLIERPYGVVANPNGLPKAIHISTFDSHPLAPNYGITFHGAEYHFQTGIKILQKICAGTIHLNTSFREEIPSVFSHVTEVQLNKFAGPHPTGCVGVQIHHLDPINKGDVVWTINPFGVIQLGKLFLNGHYDASRIVALTGSSVKQPQYYKMITGASVEPLLKDNLIDKNPRVISGNVLTGKSIGMKGHLGFFDHQITVIPEGNHYEFMGWIKPSIHKISFHRALGLLSFLSKKERAPNTNTHGEPRAFVMSGALERVTPMDILPVHLIKSILARDYDEMEALGIYELIEEDLGLCEFIDISKHPIQKILREGLELMQTS